MFEAGFTCILSKSLMNTRTSREPRHAIRVVEVLFLSFSLADSVCFERSHKNIDMFYRNSNTIYR